MNSAFLNSPRCFVRTLLLLALLLAGREMHALEKNRPIRHFGRRVWQTDEGLPQNTVNCILQTRDGYLWIGTEGGLARFDGIQFTVFNRSTTPQLPWNQINSLYQDAQGVLWISTADGLTSLDGTHWSALTTQDGLPSNQVSSVYQDQKGMLWITTANGFVADWKGKVQSFASANSQAAENVVAILSDAQGVVWIAGDQGIQAYDNGKWTTVYPGNVTGFTRSPQGILWAATDRGIGKIENGKLRFELDSVSLHGAEVETILADRSGVLWIGTSSGLDVWDGHTFTSDSTRNGLPGNAVHTIFEDREGTVWVSTDHGVARFVHGVMDTFVMDTFTTKEGLSAPLVLSMFEDQEGSLWLGTDAGGMTMLRNQVFTSYTSADGLTEENTKAIFASQDHAAGQDSVVWIGTDGGGLVRMSQQRFQTIRAKDGLASNIVLAIAPDAQDGLWVGTPDGLDHIQKDGHITRLTSADGLADDFVRSLLADGDRSLWIGTRHGLSHWKNGIAESYTQMDGLNSDFIGALAKDSNGNLWIGTLNGLNEWSQGKFSSYTTHDGLSSDIITALYADSKSALWIGTKGGGLNRLKNGRLFSYGGIDSIPQNIYGFIEDKSGNLWISSDRGIFKLSLASLNDYAAGRSKNVSLVAYGTADGMPTSQCSSGGHPAVSKSVDGTLWFATPRGVTSIQPEDAAYNTTPPPVAMEQVSIDGKGVPSNAALLVSPGHTRYAFRYAGLSFVAPQRVRFRYRLEGFDPAWIDAGTRRQAEYTNLKPGKYRFRVIAENNDNVWNDTGASFLFQVEPHIYQTVWFYLALIALLAFTAYELYRVRVRQMQSQFGAVLAERNRIAREIHDTLAQGFVGISLQLEIAKRLLADSNHAVKEHLDTAISQVGSSLSEARRSIWDLRSQNSGTVDIPARLSEIVQQTKKKSTAEIALEIHGAYRSIPEKTAHELVKIVQEAIINAVRHARASHILVQVNYESASVHFSVADDGKGFTEVEAAHASAGGHFGLTGMKERARMIQAVFQVESKLDLGTKITVRIDL